MTQPQLTTGRLLLRPFVLADSPIVKELAGDERVAATTLLIPHPYEVEMAEQWIRPHAEDFNTGKAITYAVCKKEDGALIGSVGLSINQRHKSALLGYWIAVPFWGNGYCTEACTELLKFAVPHFGLQKISSRHLSINPASGRVMQKLGMHHEGTLYNEVIKNGERLDMEHYGLVINTDEGHKLTFSKV